MKQDETITLGEKQVRKYLETLGFHVTKIPESPLRQEPDFLVRDEVSQYLIEIKDKDNQKFIDLLNSQPANDKVNLEFDNSISAIIRDSARQLDSYEGQGEIFKILWFFVGANIFDSSISMQIGKTLYGLQELEGYKRSGEFFQTLCFYFTYSEFYRCKQLDAVIVQSSEEKVLCVNDFSSKRDSLRQARLYQHFYQNGLQIIEPSKSHCYVADDFTLDRKNSKEVAEYVGRKYDLKKITAYTYSLFNLPLE